MRLAFALLPTASDRLRPARPSPRLQLNVGAAVGAGILSVVRSHPSYPEPFVGLVPIQTGEIGDDLAHYLADSEQLASAVAVVASGYPIRDNRRRVGRPLEIA